MSNHPSKQSRIYTRQGDEGMTSLVGGERISKDDLRIDCYGTIDELNSILGLIQSELQFGAAPKLQTFFSTQLSRIQNQLFNIGSRLACVDDELREKLPPLKESSIGEMEAWMDEMSESLAPLKTFVLPGGAPVASHFHLARTVARRAERRVVHLSQQAHVETVIIKYLNRLSDTFFVCSRFANAQAGITEPTWDKSVT